MQNSPRPIALLLIAAIALLASAACYAHFNLNANIRIFHVVHTNEGLELYLRTPTSYFLAELVEVQQDGTQTAAPFTYNNVQDEVLLHYLDLKQIRQDTPGFADLAVSGLKIASIEQALIPEVVSVRVHPVLEQPVFASLETAVLALQGEVWSYDESPVYVGDTVTDLHVLYASDKPIDTYTIASTFDPDLPAQEETANFLIDYFSGNVRIFQLTGNLNNAVEISNSSLAAAVTFVKEGIVHIIEGLDHLLFVLCLTVGAVRLTGLLWRVTGFTIGHTITLIAGFWGYVPSGAWFIPTVELGIALSIIYAAWIGIGRIDRSVRHHGTFIVTLLIGLLHGLGFSFVLNEMLLPNSAHLWKSLVAFNVGVEIGQVIIVLVAWLILQVISKVKQSFLNPARLVLLMPCIVVAAYWSFERAISLFTVMS